MLPVSLDCPFVIALACSLTFIYYQTMYLRGFLHLQMSHPLASTSKPCSQYMAHIISGQTEMIEHVDVLGLFLHVRTNSVRLHLNKLAYNNLQFSRTAIAEKQYFLAKQNIFNILMQE